MPVNVNGAPLVWSAELDTENFIAGQKQIEASIQKTTITAINESKKQEAALKQSVQAVNTELQKSTANNPFKANFDDIAKGAEQAAPSIEKVSESLSGSERSAAAFAKATDLLNAAQQAQIVGTEGATAAQLGLNAAMLASPLGILVGALIAAYEAYQLVASQLAEFDERQKASNEAIAEGAVQMNKLIELSSQLYKGRADALQAEVSLAQAQGKSESEILEKQLKATEAKKDEHNLALGTLGIIGTTTEELRKQIDFKREELYFEIEKQKALLQQKDIQKEQLEITEARVKFLEAEFNTANAAYKGILAANSEVANIQAEQAKKAHDDALASAKGEADARLAYARKNSKEELDARIADIKAAAAVELNNVNLTSGERKKIIAQEAKDISDAQRNYRILQLTNQKELIQAGLEQVEIGSAQELQLRIDLLNKTAQIERAQDGVTNEHKKEIAAKLAKDISDITKKFALDNQKADLETAIAGINQRLVVVEQGSEQELELKKKLIDQKAALDIVSSEDQIHNEVLLKAKIKEINAKARLDEKKADDEYYDRKLKEQISAIERANELSKIPLQKIISNPLSTPTAKFDAERQSLENDFLAVNQEMDKIQGDIDKGRGNIAKLKDQLSALEVKGAKIAADIDNLAIKRTAERLQEVTKDLGNVVSAFNSLADSIEPFNKKLADTVRQLSSAASIAGDIATAFTKAKDDPLAAAAAGASAVNKLAALFAQAKESAAKAKDDIANFNLQILKGEIDINLQYRERLRTQQQINDLTLDGIVKRRIELEKERQDSVSDYNRILKQIQEQSFISGQHTETTRSVIGGLVGYFTGFGSTTKAVNDMSSLAGKSFDDLQKLFLNGQLDEKAKSLFEELQKLKQEGADIDAAIEENKKKAQEVFTATTADNILDSIVQAFADGKKATADFADNFEGLMRQAILNSFKYQTLEKPLKDFYDQFAGMAQSDNKLTAAEIERLRTIYNSIISNAATQFDQLQQLTNINLSGAGGSGNTLAGAIKGMTEQQADLLAGQFNGLRLTAFDQLNVAKASLLTLNQIENNTASMLVTMNGYYSKWDRTGLKVV
jgi:hypothetical protein